MAPWKQDMSYNAAPWRAARVHRTSRYLVYTTDECSGWKWANSAEQKCRWCKKPWFQAATPKISPELNAIFAAIMEKAAAELPADSKQKLDEWYQALPKPEPEKPKPNGDPAAAKRAIDVHEKARNAASKATQLREDAEKKLEVLREKEREAKEAEEKADKEMQEALANVQATSYTAHVPEYAEPQDLDEAKKIILQLKEMVQTLHASTTKEPPRKRPAGAGAVGAGIDIPVDAMATDVLTPEEQAAAATAAHTAAANAAIAATGARASSG